MLHRFTLVLSLLCLFACARQGADSPASGKAQLTSQTQIEIPKLLERAAALRNGTEWDNVQNQYGSNAAKLRQNPNDQEARLKLAEVFISEARVTGEHPHYYPAAKSMLEPVVAALTPLAADAPADQRDRLFRALSHLASVQLSLHDFALARETAQKAIAVNPYNAYIYGCLVDACVEMGDYKTAVEMCDKMVGIRPDLRSYARVSYLREIHGDVPGAIEAMDLAVKAGYPGMEQTEWARLQLGQLYERYGKLKEAEDQYRICLATRENYPFALAALGELEIKKGKTAEGEKLLLQAADIIPEVGFYVEMAKLAQQTGRTEEAQKLVVQIQEMMQEDIAAGHNMSLEAARFHLEVSHDYDKALQFAGDELARRPDNKDVNQLCAALWLAKGDKTKAAEFLRKASITHSKDPELAELKKKLG